MELIDNQKARDDIKIVERSWSKKASFELEHGAKGVYCGNVHIGDQQYGVIEHERKLTLVQSKLCKELDLSSSIIIKRNEDWQFKIEVAPFERAKIAEKKQVIEQKEIKPVHTKLDLELSSEPAKKNEKVQEKEAEKSLVKTRDFEIEM